MHAVSVECTQTEQIKEMTEMHQEMKDQMQDQFMRMATLLMNRLRGQNSSEVRVPTDQEERAPNANMRVTFHF